MKKTNLILLGAPGSGKGTLAALLCKALGIPQVATGDLFRNNLKDGAPLGKLAKSYMDKGELVPDGVTADMVKDRLAQPDTKSGFILDGFPRTVAQAELLENILSDMSEKITGVLYLEVPDEEIVERLSGRLVCEKCQMPFHVTYSPPKVAGICDKCGGKLYVRDDDKPETVRKRLEVYRSNTLPLVKFYSAKGLLKEVPPTLDKIHSSPEEAAKKLGLL